MANYKLNIAKLDYIIKKTIEALEKGKQEICDIAESARNENKKLEEELKLLQKQVKELIESIEITEQKLKESKKRLLMVSKNFDQYSQEDLKNAYEIADNLRVELAIKRENEQFLIKRRNDLEIRLKESIKTIQKADSLIQNVGVALSYLTGDLKEMSLQLEDMQQKQMLGLRIIQAQEEERQRVAREIHDGPAQSMSNVVLKAEICEKLIDVDLDKTRTELQQLKKIVRDCLQDVRRIIYNLRPMSLDDLGLVPTLQRYILTFQEQTGIEVSFKTKGLQNCELKPAIALTVFRIVQECISNISKHSLAEKAVVSLEASNGELKIHIYDDGRGFDPESLKLRDGDINCGFGLISMRERIELLNGEFSLYSRPGKGTRLDIKIPLLDEEEVTNEQD